MLQPIRRDKPSFKQKIKERIIHLKITYEIWCGYYDNKFAPLRCMNCDSWHHSDHIQCVHDSINGHVCEYSIKCRLCDSTMGYWAYGNFEPLF